MTLCIAVIGTSDQSCWLAEACKILLLLFFLPPPPSLLPIVYPTSSHPNNPHLSPSILLFMCFEDALLAGIC